MGPSKQPKNTLICKKNPLKTHSRSRRAKRLRLEGAKPLKLTTLTHFQLFFQTPSDPKKGTKMGSKMEPQGTQNRKKSRTTSTQKIIKSHHSKKFVTRSIFDSKRDWVFVAGALQKSQLSKTSSKWALGPPKWDPGPLK